MKQFLIILVSYLLGHFVSVGLGLPVPANVLGLIFLFAALCLKIVKLSDVEQTADFVTQHLALIFLVPTVGVMEYFDLLASSFVRILVPLLAAILVGFFVTGQVTQLMIRRMAAGRAKRGADGQAPGSGETGRGGDDAWK